MRPTWRAALFRWPRIKSLHATQLALLSPQQSNLRRHRTWSFHHSCPDACCPGRVSSAAKQKADNAGDNEIENRADHHAADSAEQHEDVGLTKQHPDHQSADEGTKDAGD